MTTSTNYQVSEIGKMFFVVYNYGFERMPEIMSKPYATRKGAERAMQTIKHQAGA